jgi:hypothetical protein
MKSSIYPKNLSQHSSFNLETKMEVHKRLKTLTLIYKLPEESNFIRGGTTRLCDFGEPLAPGL